jgi:primosomal protein N' (replication factor Y) (superfamily II helicase)
VGAGSERLAEHLTAMFPRSRVRRVDPSVLEGIEGTPRFEDADIYLTTWVGTKASLRPDVSLVGVLDADALIRRPDYRAAERAYQALAEMSEWAGPAAAGGRLVIQTVEPSHHTLQALVRADYDFFLRRELQHRKELSYPPFSEIVKVTAIGEGAEQMLETVRKAAARKGARVLGPIRRPSRGDEVPGVELMLKCRAAENVSEELRTLVQQSPAGTRLIVDVDPL